MAVGGVSVRDVDVSPLRLSPTNGSVEPRAQWKEMGVLPSWAAGKATKGRDRNYTEKIIEGNQC